MKRYECFQLNAQLLENLIGSAVKHLVRHVAYDACHSRTDQSYLFLLISDTNIRIFLLIRLIKKLMVEQIVLSLSPLNNL